MSAVIDQHGHHGDHAEPDHVHAELLGQFVERRENAVEHGEHLLRRHAFGQPGEIDDIHEHHGDIGKAVGDSLLLVFQTLGDGTGENVEQQALGALLFAAQLAMGGGQAGAVLLAQGLAGLDDGAVGRSGAGRMRQRDAQGQQGQTQHALPRVGAGALIYWSGLYRLIQQRRSILS